MVYIIIYYYYTYSLKICHVVHLYRIESEIAIRKLYVYLKIILIPYAFKIYIFKKY